MSRIGDDKMLSNRAHLLVGLIVVGVALSTPIAADEIWFPNDLKPGPARPVPTDTMASAATIVDVGIASPVSVAEALLTQFKDDVPRSRGPRDISLFRETAPSVVLIKTKDGLGTGSLLKDNTILTSLHVVDGQGQITVVFKPSDPRGTLRGDEVSSADVIKADRQRDLALLRPKSLPSHPIRPLDLSPLDSVEVGSDVFAIGHPTGDAWTFTKGIVSQFRPNYEWSAGPRKDHYRATVIQTQTPINPGNSGGPLLSEDGKIVGVNAFKNPDAEGLNFAIAASDVRLFLANPKSDLLAQDSCSEANTIFKGRNSKDNGFLVLISLQCDDKADITIFAADDQRKPVVAYLDLKRRGKPEAIVYDQKRTGKWNFSYWDVEFDDTFPLKGLHPDGKFMPSKFEPRCPPGAKPLSGLKCSPA